MSEQAKMPASGSQSAADFALEKARSEFRSLHEAAVGVLAAAVRGRPKRGSGLDTALSALAARMDGLDARRRPYPTYRSHPDGAA